MNLSTGYYNAHRTHELIDTETMATNVERVIEMIMTPSEHYKYQSKFTSRTKFPWCGSLFDQQIMDITCEDQERKQLMRLPEDARLFVNGQELKSTQSYMVDRSGTVYAYIEGLDAAVESEILIACNADGQEVRFSYYKAERIRVISYEEAMSRLEEAQVVL